MTILIQFPLGLAVISETTLRLSIAIDLPTRFTPPGTSASTTTKRGPSCAFRHPPSRRWGRLFGEGYQNYEDGEDQARPTMTPQKPAKRALEQNSAQVRYWFEHKSPAIKRHAASEKGKI